MLLFRSRKILIVALMCFILSSILVGCGEGTVSNSNKETTNTVTSDNTPNNTTQETTNAETKEEPLGFSIAMSNSGNEYIIKTADISKEKWINAFNDKFNTKMTVKLLDVTKISQDIQLMFASGEIPDLLLSNISLTAQPIVGALQADVFMPLDELIEKNKNDIGNINSLIPAGAWDLCKYNGKTYAIPSIYLSISTRRATFIRRDLMDKYNLQTPKTIDEYIVVLKAFKQNGVKYPYAGREDFSYTDAFFGAYGVALAKEGICPHQLP